MSTNDQIDTFIEWLSTLDVKILRSEDDVETKFVIPFFQQLNYPDAHRRGKYSIDDYQTGKGKRGRKPEIDQIYFSESEENKLSQDTSLLLVEAKEPQKRDLEDAIKQARYYGNHLAPLILVVTNGYRLIILKRHNYRSEEVIFDGSINKLLNRTVATTIYKQLQFDFVKQLKNQRVDILTHSLYAELIEISNRYPDLQVQLAKGDFEPSTTKEKNSLTVIKQTVAIKCELPIVFKEGSCSITFSSIMLRGLTCNLSHSEILSDLFIGLGTSPYWNTRRFLTKEGQNTFKAHLGQTIVLLSERETYDLCEAVDEVCQTYKDLMIEATNILETWSFTPITIDNTQGFCLFSVKKWLWNLMHEFTYEFDYDEGNTAWHIFDRSNSAIRVNPRNVSDDHVIILPRMEEDYLRELLPSDVELLYTDSITYLGTHDDASRKSLYEDVGVRGVWTASYTRVWLLKVFIPKVLSYYLGTPQSSTNRKKLMEILPPSISSIYVKRRKKILTSEHINSIIQEAVYDSFHLYEAEIPLTDIENPKLFEFYINEIQSLFHVYGAKNVPASIVRPFYSEFAKLARCVNPTTINTAYIRAKLIGIWRRRKIEGIFNELPEGDLFLTWNSILDFLDQQVTHINEIDYEDHANVDLISRVFIAIAKEGVFNVSQSQLNTTKQGLIPLWNLCHFEMRFIKPIIFGYQEKL